MDLFQNSFSAIVCKLFSILFPGLRGYFSLPGCPGREVMTLTIIAEVPDERENFIDL